jgi:hypothetical protein
VIRNWLSDAWLTFRVELGDWLIELGHRVADDPLCKADGCKMRRDATLDFCLKHESMIRAHVATPLELEGRRRA